MGALASVEDDGCLEVALQVAEASKQRGDFAGSIFVDAMEANQRVEDQHARLDAADGLEQPLSVVGQIEAHSGNHVDVEIVKTGSCGLGNAVQTLAHDVGGVFGGEQQDSARDGGEASQAGRAGGDGDSEVECEKGFAALRFASDDADRLFAPQLFDAPLLWLFGELRGPAGGESDRAPLRLSGVKISKNSSSSVISRSTAVASRLSAILVRER